MTPTTIVKNIQSGTNLSKTNSIETKDATLIELLKRGTKVAVKCNSTDPNGSTLTFKPNTTTQSATVLLPTNVSSTSSNTPTKSPLAISLSNNSVKSAPLALTISQNMNGSSDVYTLAYSTDSTSTFFNENDVYNVPDTSMLLQAVDSIQLLQNSTGSSQLGDISRIGEYTLTDGGDLNDANLLSQYTPSRQIQAVLNSPLPESLAEFSTLHSKDYLLYGTESQNDDSATVQTSNSPLPTSPLSYPTPPASHEGITQSSPFLDDTHHFSDANSIFIDKKNISFLDENGLLKDMKDSRLSDCEQILKLKHELFNETKVVMDDTLYFKTEVEDEYNSKASIDLPDTNNHTENIDDFNGNLSFLDETRNFLVDSRTPSSPLSAAFFTGTMSSAEEVKEALQEVLPNESITCEQNNDIDLYYLPSAAFQSQMMLNSDDPLLSSSPKDFIIKHPINRFEFDPGSSAKKPKLDAGVNVEKSKILITSQSENIGSETFLSPSNLPTNVHSTVITTGNSNNNNNNNNYNSICSSNSTTVEFSQPLVKDLQTNVRRNISYKSNLRKASAPYYTPLPMLDPKRIASGLYAMEISTDASDEMAGFGFTENTEFDGRSKANIGSDFQAIIPSMETKSGYEYEENERIHILWNPNVLQNEKQIQRFVELAKSSAVPLACHSEEMALKALYDANGNIPNAILKMLQEPPSSIYNRWQPQEVETFLNGLETHGKNFYKISKEVEHHLITIMDFFYVTLTNNNQFIKIPSKTTGNCVQFYYFWKKLCVHYKSTHLSSEFNSSDANSSNATNQQEARPHVCEMPDCSAVSNKNVITIYYPKHQSKIFI